MDRKVNLMLDSGAFSAWRQQKPINLKEYAKYLEHNYDIVDTAINLDVIPGEWGKTRTLVEVDYAAEQGFKNFLQLKNCGFDTVPVFHQGERLYWLEKMLGEGCEYIGLAPINRAGSISKRHWLDKVFTFLCGSKGFPEVKVHGFAVTATSLMIRYPWYSVDSISWILIGGFGNILVPRYNQGKFDYLHTPNMVSISTRGSKFTSSIFNTGRSYRTLGREEKNYVDRYCTSSGFAIPDLENNHWTRKELNCLYYKMLEKNLSQKPFHSIIKNLFADNSVSKFGTSSAKFKKLTFIFGCGDTHKGHSAILQRQGISSRLLPYNILRNVPDKYLPHYVKTGQFPSKGRILLKSSSTKTKRVRLTKTTRIKLKG